MVLVEPIAVNQMLPLMPIAVSQERNVFPAKPHIRLHARRQVLKPVVQRIQERFVLVFGV